jgi:hypothetical protein
VTSARIAVQAQVEGTQAHAEPAVRGLIYANACLFGPPLNVPVLSNDLSRLHSFRTHRCKFVDDLQFATDDVEPILQVRPKPMPLLHIGRPFKRFYFQQ